MVPDDFARRVAHAAAPAEPASGTDRDEDGVVVWYNERCSKCLGAAELLAALGVPARRVHYLDSPPDRDEIRRVLRLLGASDPRLMMRTSEPRYRELDLDNAPTEDLVDAMATYPELIERPIVIRADRAVIARPPEILLSLLDASSA